MLKTQQGFKRQRHNVFTEEINKITLTSNDDKRTQSIDSIETYVYGMSDNIIHAKKKLISTKQYKKLLIFIIL